MNADSTITIGLLLPDVLGTYSDGGNATVLAQRLRWRGFPAVVHAITARTEPAQSCEIYLLGGGEDRAQQYATTWLRDHPKLLDTISQRAITLAVCAGMQILGRRMTDPDGHEHPGLGVLDITTTPRAQRAIGETVTECQIPEVGFLTGFENHRGATTLMGNLAPLGQVVAGIGNGADAAVDGVLTDHVIGTYLHGPVLARNPALADHILHRVIGRPQSPIDLPDLPALRRRYLRRPGTPLRTDSRLRRSKLHPRP